MSNNKEMQVRQKLDKHQLQEATAHLKECIWDIMDQAKENSDLAPEARKLVRDTLKEIKESAEEHLANSY